MTDVSGAAEAFRQSLHLLATRRFGTFWVSTLLSNIGTWAQQVAEPWLLLSLGASPFLIGLDSFAMNAPVWALTLLGGVLADRADRRRVIALFQSIQMICPTLIVVILIVGWVHPMAIIALSLVVGVTDALSMPSFQSIVPSIVRREQIAQGLALNSTQFNLSRILGPAIAGVLMASVGAVACFALSAASYIPFIGVALWIVPANPDARPREAPELRALVVALRGALRQPAVGGALLTVFATSVLCAPLTTFVPVLVKAALNGDAGDFSLAIGAFGVGGLLGATGLLAIPLGYDRRRLSSRLAMAYGLIVAAISLAPAGVALPALMAVAGMAMTISNTSANSVLQTHARADQLGQTVSLFMLATRGGQPIGALLTGLCVEALGVRHALLLNGALALLVQAGIARFWLRGPALPPRLREPEPASHDP